MCPCLCSDVLGVRLLVLLRVVLGLCVGDFTTQGRVCLSGFGPHVPHAKAWCLGFGPCQGLGFGVWPVPGPEVWGFCESPNLEGGAQRSMASPERGFRFKREEFPLDATRHRHSALLSEEVWRIPDLRPQALARAKPQTSGLSTGQTPTGTPSPCVVTSPTHSPSTQQAAATCPECLAPTHAPQSPLRIPVRLFHGARRAVCGLRQMGVG